METPLEKLNAKLMSEQLHSKFKAQMDSGVPVELELCEVNEPPKVPNLEQFTLVFRGPTAPRLPQKLYRLEHASLGTVQIFMTAIAGNEEGILYEAVFNRVRKKTST